MRSTSASLALLCLPLTVTCIVDAQQPTTAFDPAAARTPFSLQAPPMAVANIDEPFADGVYQVRGDNYKARIEASGVTFFPLFPAAPGHTPARFRYQGADAAKVERHGQVLTLQHDQNLVERWHAEVHGMEQVFVLLTRPAADFVLRVQVETDLRYLGYQHDPDARGLLFAAEGLGRMLYGEGVAFDAAGRRIAVVPQFDHGVITLPLPAAFLAEAVYPVTVDPLVSNLTVSQATGNDVHPDVARDPTGNGDFIVIFEEVINGSDRDIIGHRYRTDGTFVSRLFFESGSDSCITPKICATLGATSLLAVWDNNGGQKGIQARNYRLTQSIFEPTAQVTSDGAIQDCRDPDIGGGTTQGVNNIGQMVVFVRRTAGVNFALLGIRLQSNGIAIGNEFVIDAQPGCDPKPDISPSGGNPLHWGVVWQKLTTLCNGGDIWWAAVNGGGVLLPAAPLEAGPEDELLPRVVTNGLDSFIGWHQDTANGDVNGVTMRRSAVGSTFSQVGAKFNLSSIEPNCPLQSTQNQVALSHDGCRVSYAYMEGQRPRAACLFAEGAVFSDGHVSLSGTGNNCGAPAMALTPTDTSPVRHVVVWQENFGTHFEIRGAFYEGREAGATLSVLPTRCGTHGTTGISLDGIPALGARFFVNLTAVAGVPLLLAGPPGTPAPLCVLPLSTCQIGVSQILVSFVTTSLGVTVPCDPILVGSGIAFQGVDIAAPGGCGPSLLGLPFRTTDTLVLTIR